MVDLHKQIHDILTNVDGVWGICAKKLDNDEIIYEYNKDHEFSAASVNKIAIALYVFSQIDQKLADPKEIITLVEENKLGGGVLYFLDAGLNLTLMDTVKLMLSISDNTAAKHLVKRFTPQKINAYLETIGLKITQLEIEGDKFTFGNTTPLEMATILDGIYKSKYFSAELCNTFLEIMKRDHNDLGIRRYLPEYISGQENKLRVANKAGTIPGVRNDVSVVFDKEPYVLTIFANDLSDTIVNPDNKGVLAIAKISKIIYESLNSASNTL